MRILVFVFICCLSMPTHARLIFKCIRPDLSVYYQATGCRNAQDQQTFVQLPNRTVPQLQPSPTDKKPTKQQKRKTKALEKKEQQAKKRHLRLQAQCERVTRQIEDISQLYRNGYTVKRGIILDRKLAEYKDRKRKYCSNE